MSENEASNGSSKSSEGPSSGSSRLDSTASGSSGMSAVNSSSSGLGPSPHGSVDSSAQHSHISSLKTSVTHSDSAYGGSNTQSQRSGSGSGSRSSKSQISSNSSNNAGTDQQQPKSRKDKEPKKRKSKQTSTIPLIRPGEQQQQSSSGNFDRPASVGSNKGTVSSAAALISSAAATAVANACSVESGSGGVLSSPGKPTEAGLSGSGGAVASSSSSGMLNASASNSGMGSSRTKLPRAGCGIRGVTESRAVQAAALSRALDSLSCLKDTNVGLVSPAKEIQCASYPKEDATSCSWRSILMDPLESSLKKTFAHLEEVPSVKSKEAFIAAISLQDGIVVYVTPSLTDRLGYPAEMWCGRSLLDFIHPKDRLAFTNQITSKLLASLDKDDSPEALSFGSEDGMFPRGMIGSSSAPPNMLCSRLRMYRGLRTSGFGIVDKKTSYMPFRINLILEKIKLPDGSATKKETVEGDEPSATQEVDDDSESEYFLLAYAKPICSAYKVPDEKSSTGQFGLRHSSNCLFSEVDMSSVPFLGHLPQDLLGTSALEFYHPNDLPELKKIYDSVIGRQGKSIRSKPYNFRAFNGCYVLLETDWTCFVNPWTKKLEFVAGHHRVLKGPSNPDVFANPPEGSGSLDSMDAAAAENVKKLHAEICTILTGSPKPPQQARQNRVDAALLETATRRRKNLATLMGSLIEEVAKVRGSHSGENSCSSGSYPRCKPLLIHSPAEGSLLGDLSVVMGDISTHGGSGLDSNSADTPLSYSLLNYNQNLERYFQSQPKMIPSEGSGDSSGNGSGNGSGDSSKPGMSRTTNMSSEEEGGCQGNADSSGTMPSSDSQKLSSSKSNSNSRSTDSQNDGSFDPDYIKLPLTKEVLGRHNEEMENKFMQQHRELRNKTTSLRRPGTSHHRKEPHGVKRGQAPSWEEGGPRNRQKHPHMEEMCTTPLCYQSPSAGTAPGQFNDWASLTGPSLIPSNLLPPFSVASGTPPHQSSGAVFSVPVAGNRSAEVTNSLPTFYLAPTPTAVNSSGVRMSSAAIGHQQAFMQPFSIQPYGLPHGSIFYQPVMVPPMLFQPGVGMMMPTSPMVPQRAPAPRPRLEPYGMAGMRRDPGTEYPLHHNQRGPRPLYKRTPPWMESVIPCPELVYQYQVPGRNSSEVLEADRDRLRQLQQPALLNHQLDQLYSEMEAEQGDRMRDLAIDEGENSTSSSNMEDTNQKRRELRRRSAEFRRTMLYEENAPFPQPNTESSSITE